MDIEHVDIEDPHTRPIAIYGAPLERGAGLLPVVKHTLEDGLPVLRCEGRLMAGNVQLLTMGQPDPENGLWPIGGIWPYKPYVFYIGSELVALFEKIGNSLGVEDASNPVRQLLEGVLPSKQPWGRYALVWRGDEEKIKEQLLDFLLYPNPSPRFLAERGDLATAIDRKNEGAWWLYIRAAEVHFNISFRQAAESLDLTVDEVKRRFGYA